MPRELRDRRLLPRGWVALLPGQGATGSGVPADARSSLEFAADSLGLAHSDLLNPPDVQSSRWQQLTTLCTGFARAKRLTRDFGTLPAFVAGHSLGEITAYLCAGVLSFEEAIRLVAKRGEFMDRCCLEHPGIMVAVRGATQDELTRICAEYCATVVANVNSLDQLVVSGPATEVQAVLHALPVGCYAKELPVAGAFHSPLMEAAQEQFRELLGEISWQRPHVPVISSVDGAILETAEECADRLAVQMTSPVQWTAVMRTIERLRPSHLIDLGPGSVLAEFLRVHQRSVGSPRGSAVSSVDAWEPGVRARYASAIQRDLITRMLLEARCAPSTVNEMNSELLRASISELTELARAASTKPVDYATAMRAVTLRDSVVATKAGRSPTRAGLLTQEDEWTSR